MISSLCDFSKMCIINIIFFIIPVCFRSFRNYNQTLLAVFFLKLITIVVCICVTFFFYNSPGKYLSWSKQTFFRGAHMTLQGCPLLVLRTQIPSGYSGLDCLKRKGLLWMNLGFDCSDRVWGRLQPWGRENFRPVLPVFVQRLIR